MFINASRSWNEYRYLLTYKHQAFKMVSLACPRGREMQPPSPQRLGTNSISLHVQCSLGLRVWELRTRAVRAGDYTLIATQKRILVSANTLFAGGFCAQASSHVPVTLSCLYCGSSVMAFVVWSIPPYLQTRNPEFAFAACMLGTVTRFGVASFLFVWSYLCWYLIPFSSRRITRIKVFR